MCWISVHSELNCCLTWSCKYVTCMKWSICPPTTTCSTYKNLIDTHTHYTSIENYTVYVALKRFNKRCLKISDPWIFFPTTYKTIINCGRLIPSFVSYSDIVPWESQGCSQRRARWPLSSTMASRSVFCICYPWLSPHCALYHLVPSWCSKFERLSCNNTFEKITVRLLDIFLLK